MHISVVYLLYVVGPILCVGLCLALVLCGGSWCPFELSNHLAKEERAEYFTLIVLWLSGFCFSSS